MIESIFHQILLFFPLILGAYLSISLMKVPDLSLESAYLFGAVMGGLTASEGIVSYFIAICGGAAVGALTGVLNQLCRLPFLLSAIVVNGLFHGIAQFALKGALLSIKPSFETGWTMLIVITIVLVSVSYLLLRSQLGYAFAIYGNNPLFFKRHHVSTKYVVIFGTVLGGAAAGLSGYLFATANGFVDVTMNYGIVLLGITALMLGKVFLDKQQPNLVAPFIGVVLFFVLQHALIKCGFSLRYFNAFQAVMILAIWVFSQRAKVRFATDHLGV
jgi:putative ABC transport system permease protein